MPSRIKVGDKFGELTILEDTKKRAPDGSIIWRCSCSCGNNNYETVSAELRRKPPRNKIHCNNTIHNIKDISGKVFGEVEVLSFSDITNKKAYFNCKCLRCNKLFRARGNDLLTHHVQSCGCRKGYSKGAEKIFNILSENNILFKTEISFKDCLTEKNNAMFFDFGIYNEAEELLYLIEYDGEQHYYYNNGDKTWNTEEHFKRTKMRDNIKNVWCKNHNIPLIRIPYFNIETITIEDLCLETSNYIN